MPVSANHIRKLLQERLHPSYLEVADDSASHAGHQGARQGGGHYTVVIECEAFRGKPLLEQHRMVHAALANEFGGGIHALALSTRVP